MDDAIMGLTEQECRAVLLVLAGMEGPGGLTEQAIGRVLAKTRPQEGDQGEYAGAAEITARGWHAASVTITGEQEAQEKEAQWLLETLADRTMSEGNEYGGPLPHVFAPVVFAAIGKEVVVEFHGTLHDGTRVTTTRPLAAKS
jgi:hypothetical protein